MSENTYAKYESLYVFLWKFSRSGWTTTSAIWRSSILPGNAARLDRLDFGFLQIHAQLTKKYLSECRFHSVMLTSLISCYFCFLVTKLNHSTRSFWKCAVLSVTTTTHSRFCLSPNVTGLCGATHSNLRLKQCKTDTWRCDNAMHYL